MRMKCNDFAFNVPSVKLEYFAVPYLSWQLMLERNKTKEMLLEAISKCQFLSLKCIIPPKRGKRAVLGGSAIPRQPVARAKQASIPWPKSKNQFNI